MKFRCAINADDFGVSRNVNRAISDSFNNGLITNTTLMVNQATTEEAVEIAYKNNFEGNVGLHLNLTSGKPLTKQITKNSLLCDSNGNFIGKFHINRKNRITLDANTINVISEEIKAQIDKYFSFGFNLGHLDSHHHVHHSLTVLKAIGKAIQGNTNIRSIRTFSNIPRKISWRGWAYEKVYNQRFLNLGLKSTDYFGSMNSYIAELDNGISYIASDTMELMVHPKYIGNEIVDVDQWGSEQPYKFKLLKDKVELVENVLVFTPFGDM